jgi:hypothetical protein
MGNGNTGQVYVSADDAPEQTFSTAPDVSVDAPWVQAGKIYEFRLYNADHTKLLGNVLCLENFSILGRTRLTEELF